MSDEWETQRLLIDNPYFRGATLYYFRCPDPECENHDVLLESSIPPGLKVYSDQRPDDLGEIVAPVCAVCDKILEEYDEGE